MSNTNNKETASPVIQSEEANNDIHKKLDNLTINKKDLEKNNIEVDASTKNILPANFDILPKSSLKSSQEKNLRKKIIEDIPEIETLLDTIWPKKISITVGKIKPHTLVYFVNENPILVQVDKYPITPHMKLALEYPNLLPICQVDKGAIKFVIGGANVMCPGLTSKGGMLPDIDMNQTVIIKAEEKEHPLAIGYTVMNSNQIKKENKGIALELIHHLGDEIWYSK